MEIKKVPADYVFNIDDVKPLEGQAAVTSDGITRYLTANDSVSVSLVDGYISDVLKLIRADMTEILRKVDG